LRDAARRIYEQVLVLRCQAGDDGAFTELVGLYSGRIGYFVRRMLADAASADDVLQETWLAAFRGLGRLRSPAALPVWLYRIARDKACHELRRRRQWVELADDAAAPDDPAAGEPPLAPEQAAAIHRGLERLAPPHREVLVLRFLEDMTYEDIAEVTGCPVGTVRSRIHYARQALRREMEDTR
jgi:RNA polymerase sigma-70 factor (ECF subfamily)